MFRDNTLSQPISSRVSSGDGESDKLHDQLRFARVAQIYAQSRAGLVMGMAVSVIAAVCLWSQAPKWLLLGWFVAFMVVQSSRLLLFRSFAKNQAEMTQRLLLNYEKWFLVGSCLSAFLWGIGATALFALVNAEHRFLLVALVAGVGASVAWAHAPIREGYVSSVVLTVAPLCVYLLSRGDVVSVALGLGGLMYMVALLGTGKAAHTTLAESIKLRFEKDRLLEELSTSRVELEHVVQQRTRELSATNEDLRREISDRTAVQEALRNSEEQLRKAQQIARVGSWGLDLVDSRITWSPEMFRILEKEPGSCDPAFEGLLDRVHPDDAPAVAGLIRDCLAGRNPHGIEYRLLMPDGRKKHVASWCEFSYDGGGQALRAVGALQDVTELRIAEASLFLTQVALDHVSEATYLFDENTRFLYVNQSACRLMECTREELLDKSLDDSGVSHFVDDWQSYWNRLTQEKVLSFEGVHRTKDGKEVPLEVTAIGFEYKGVPYYWAFVRDITQRKRAQEEGLALERRVSESHKLESLGALAGGIAHDYNNLLTAVLGNLELALADPLMSSQARTRLQRAVAASQRAVAVTRQMLAYSGKGKFVLVKVDLSQLVEEHCSLQPGTFAPDVELSMDLDRSVPSIEADPSQLRQLMGNLIVNAAEALDELPHRIGVATGVLHCDESDLAESRLEEKPRPGEFVYLQVSDTGHGMDEDTLKRLFDPFFSTKFMGRGLGMSAVMGIVRGHGGAILVDSRVGQGTTVRVLFPVVKSVHAEGPLHQFPQRDRDAISHPSALGTLLIVDDEETVRDVCREMLERCGFNVLCVADGFEGVQVMKEHGSFVDCIIFDLCIDAKDALAGLSEIRRYNPSAKVILSSGYTAKEAALRFAGMGVSGFLQKPFHMQTLVARVNEIMGSGSHVHAHLH